jgi:hypothetical protein
VERQRGGGGGMDQMAGSFEHRIVRDIANLVVVCPL